MMHFNNDGYKELANFLITQVTRAKQTANIDQAIVNVQAALTQVPQVAHVPIAAQDLRAVQAPQAPVTVQPTMVSRSTQTMPAGQTIENSAPSAREPVWRVTATYSPLAQRHIALARMRACQLSIATNRVMDTATGWNELAAYVCAMNNDRANLIIHLRQFIEINRGLAIKYAQSSERRAQVPLYSAEINRLLAETATQHENPDDFYALAAYCHALAQDRAGFIACASKLINVDRETNLSDPRNPLRSIALRNVLVKSFAPKEIAAKWYAVLAYSCALVRNKVDLRYCATKFVGADRAQAIQNAQNQDMQAKNPLYCKSISDALANTGVCKYWIAGERFGRDRVAHNITFPYTIRNSGRRSSSISCKPDMHAYNPRVYDPIQNKVYAAKASGKLVLVPGDHGSRRNVGRIVMS